MYNTDGGARTLRHQFLTNRRSYLVLNVTIATTQPPSRDRVASMVAAAAASLSGVAMLRRVCDVSYKVIVCLSN